MFQRFLIYNDLFTIIPMISSKNQWNCFHQWFLINFTNDCQKSCDFIQRFPCNITSNDIIVVTTILNRWNFKKSLETIVPVAMLCGRREQAHGPVGSRRVNQVGTSTRERRPLASIATRTDSPDYGQNRPRSETYISSCWNIR